MAGRYEWFFENNFVHRRKLLEGIKVYWNSLENFPQTLNPFNLLRSQAVPSVGSHLENKFLSQCHWLHRLFTSCLSYVSFKFNPREVVTLSTFWGKFSTMLESCSSSWTRAKTTSATISHSTLHKFMVLIRKGRWRKKKVDFEHNLPHHH